jgi:hypothetical protein
LRYRIIDFSLGYRWIVLAAAAVIKPSSRPKDYVRAGRPEAL